MRRKSGNPVPVILYKAFVFGFGGLSLIYLVAPIVIAITHVVHIRADAQIPTGGLLAALV
ncbi:hypothetical protein QE435_004895 [Rhizobium sp. SORGH_AS 787]|nr:hypothetical protein [Rhizobium sp. SORGH_AS_0787]